MNKPDDLFYYDQVFDHKIFEYLSLKSQNQYFYSSTIYSDSTMKLPKIEDILSLETSDYLLKKKWKNLGEDALSSGHVSVVILNGGMATRLGGVHKGLLEISKGNSFLKIHLNKIRNISKNINIFIMNSEFTHKKTQEHLQEFSDIHFLIQNHLPILNIDGTFFLDKNGNKILCPVGHGDIFSVLKKNQNDQKKLSRMIIIFNVENIATKIDPMIIGAHIWNKKSITCEVCDYYKDDRGGLLVYMNDRFLLIENLSFEEKSYINTRKFLNTNTMIINSDILNENIKLPWHPIKKTQKGKKTIRFERFLSEITAFLDTNFIHVERIGSKRRFLPIKNFSDFHFLQNLIQLNKLELY